MIIIYIFTDKALSKNFGNRINILVNFYFCVFVVNYPSIQFFNSDSVLMLREVIR